MVSSNISSIKIVLWGYLGIELMVFLRQTPNCNSTWVQPNQHLISSLKNKNMEKKKTKRQIVKLGDILSIPLHGGKVMYARRYKDGMGFYDYITDEIIDNVDILKNKKLLFHTGVYIDVLSSGVWPKIGKIPFEKEDDEWGPVRCISNLPFNNGFRYSHKGNDYGGPTYKECYNLEFVSACDRWHIEMMLVHYTETGKYHPRIWDRLAMPEFQIKQAWQDLYSPDILVDVLAFQERMKKERWYDDL